MAETNKPAPPKTKFTFPSSANRPSTVKSSGTAPVHPRVTFRSYPWKTAKPNLEKTVNVTKNGASSTVTLFVPANYSEQFGARWGEQDTVTALINRNWNGVQASIGETALGALDKMSGGKAISTAAKYASGSTSFPGEFLVFDRGEPITLSFTLDLLPMNKAEADEIVGVVQNFKRKILPTFGGLTTESFGLSFPEIWMIEVAGLNGTGFPETPNTFNDMALISCHVTYSGGANSVLAFHDGNPVAVQLALTFKSVRNSYLGAGA
jgi:hypothetical protein